MEGIPKIETVEKIKSAAVSYNGALFTGNAHVETIPLLMEHIKTKTPELFETIGGDEDKLLDHLDEMFGNGYTEGFVTTTGRFVSRKEAAEIAKANDQINDEMPEEDSEMRSEYLKRQ